jgi:hypothetical protein
MVLFPFWPRQTPSSHFRSVLSLKNRETPSSSRIARSCFIEEKLLWHRDRERETACVGIWVNLQYLEEWRKGMSRPYIYTSFALINHGHGSKETICYIFSAALTKAKSVKHRSSTPEQLPTRRVCKESSILHIDKYRWAQCAYSEPNKHLVLGWRKLLQ